MSWLTSRLAGISSISSYDTTSTQLIEIITEKQTWADVQGDAQQDSRMKLHEQTAQYLIVHRIQYIVTIIDGRYWAADSAACTVLVVMCWG